MTTQQGILPSLMAREEKLPDETWMGGMQGQELANREESSWFGSCPQQFRHMDSQSVTGERRGGSGRGLVGDNLKLLIRISSAVIYIY